jgi:hypothetical protein
MGRALVAIAGPVPIAAGLPADAYPFCLHALPPKVGYLCAQGGHARAMPQMSNAANGAAALGRIATGGTVAIGGCGNHIGRKAQVTESTKALGTGSRQVAVAATPR